MSETNKTLLINFYENVERDLGAAAEFLADDMQAHFGGLSKPLDKKAWMNLLRAFFKGFPDFRHNVTDVIGAGDRVGARFEASGIHRGDFMGVAPTGRKIHVSGNGIFRIENGKIAETWLNLDAAGLMHQISNDVAAHNVAQIWKIVDAVNRRSLDELDEYFWATYVHHEPGLPGQGFQGLELYKSAMRGFMSAFPDISVTLDEVFSDGQRAFGRWIIEGRPGLSMGDSAAAGPLVRAIGITSYRFVGGKVAEGWMNLTFADSDDPFGIMSNEA